jgi:hypothetical protein
MRNSPPKHPGAGIVWLWVMLIEVLCGVMSHGQPASAKSCVMMNAESLGSCFGSMDVGVQTKRPPTSKTRILLQLLNTNSVPNSVLVEAARIHSW